METKITISTDDYVLIDISRLDWNDIGGSMPAIPSNAHHVIWDGSAGEIQYNDGTVNLALTSVSDAVGSTTISSLLTWGDTRLDEINASLLANELALLNEWYGIRRKRDDLLLKCDWTQGADSPLDSGTKTSWATYRAALRDIPSTYSGTEPKLLRLLNNGILQLGTGIDASDNSITGSSDVLTPPSDIFSTIDF